MKLTCGDGGPYLERTRATKWRAQRAALMIAGCLVLVAGGVAAIEATGLKG